jgi:catechol 2,3-dioxygenase
MANNPFQIHPSTQIAHVEYQVRDLANLVAFYADLLGMPLIEKTDTFAQLSATGQPPALLTLFERKDAKPAPSNSSVPGLYHTAFRFPGRVPLASTLMRMVAARYPLQGAADHRFSEAIYLADPEGNGIELYRDRPREEWPRMGDALQSGNLPLDLRQLLEEADQAAAQAGKVDPGMDIGHIHLQVSDLAMADAFYHDLLGLDVMMSMPTALFFAAGGYHHYVGANTWHSLNAPHREKGLTGLNSFSFLIPDEAGWQAALERVKDKMPRVVERDGLLGVAIEDQDGIVVELMTNAGETVRIALQATESTNS